MILGGRSGKFIERCVFISNMLYLWIFILNCCIQVCRKIRIFLNEYVDMRRVKSENVEQRFK